MESNYFGEPNHPGLLSPSSSPASRKGKKGSSDKSKQPQRGLGVAQLEKIRLHGQLGSSYLPHVHNPYASNFSQVFSWYFWFSFFCVVLICYMFVYFWWLIKACLLLKQQEDIRPQSAYPLPSSSLSHSSASPSYGFQGHHGVMVWDVFLRLRFGFPWTLTIEVHTVSKIKSLQAFEDFCRGFDLWSVA